MKLSNVAGAIGKERGYVLVVEASAIVYADPSLDITSEVIARFNKK